MRLVRAYIAEACLAWSERPFPHLVAFDAPRLLTVRSSVRRLEAFICDMGKRAQDLKCSR